MILYTDKYSKPSSNADSNIRAKLNANKYTEKAENSVIRGLTKTLQQNTKKTRAVCTAIQRLAFACTSV
jgi:hypothetical protein